MSRAGQYYDTYQLPAGPPLPPRPPAAINSADGQMPQPSHLARPRYLMGYTGYNSSEPLEEASGSVAVLVPGCELPEMDSLK